MFTPSLELSNNNAVINSNGLEVTIEKSDVIKTAQKLSKYADLTLIDRAAINGSDVNETLIAEICRYVPAKVCGGINNAVKAKQMLSLGAQKVIVSASSNEDLFNSIPKEKIIVEIWEKDGVSVNPLLPGAIQDTAENIIKKMNAKCSGFLYTDLSRKGKMCGVNLDRVKILKQLTPHQLIVSGGISSVDEIVNLQNEGITPQLDTAISNHELNPEDIFIKSVNFEKRFGYIPTIVQDLLTKQVLMFEYSTQESLKQALRTSTGSYFDRSKNRIWVKGEESGNVQRIVFARYDSNRDVLLFKVIQKGNAGSDGQFSSFGEKEYSIYDFYAGLLDEKRLLPDDGIATTMFKDDYLLKKKIMEAAFEVVNYKEQGNLSKSAAKLEQYLLTLLAKNNVSPQEILNNLFN